MDKALCLLCGARTENLSQHWARKHPKVLMGAVMTEGKRYRIRYQLDNQRKEREVVFDYLGYSPGMYVDGYYVMSARPLAGTQQVPVYAVKSIEEVDKTTPIQLPS